MAENTPPKNTQRNSRPSGNARSLGMMITPLKPLSSEFYNYFHEKNRACLRQFNSISNAIYNIHRLIEGDTTTSTKVSKWLSGVYAELSGIVNSYKDQIEEAMKELPAGDSSFNGYDYQDFELRWNHPLTWKLVEIITNINVMTSQAHLLWLYGKISNSVHERIILQLFSSLRVAMDTITKILDAEHRVNGKYDALPFIKNIKQFKSVDLYIASLAPADGISAVDTENSTSAENNQHPTRKKNDNPDSQEPKTKEADSAVSGLAADKTSKSPEQTVTQ